MYSLRQYSIFSATHYCNLRGQGETETGKNVEVWQCMISMTCYRLTQVIGLGFWPNLFPMEYNSRPGELDTWCWCLNKVKVILKIVQFGFRNLWSSSGWHDWSTKNRPRFVTLLIYLRSYPTPHFVENSIVPTRHRVRPDPVSWQIPPLQDTFRVSKGNNRLKRLTQD